MLLIEILSENHFTYFDGIPEKHQKHLINLYFQSIKESKNKSTFIKISCLDLIRLVFIKKKFEIFDVKKIIEDFNLFYVEMKNVNPEKTKLGYEEDIKEFIVDYLDRI